jgi:two-component system chemotaxis response regulator CheY
MDKKKVLIVDDSELIRDMLQKYIERCGCLVCGVAKSGKEGIEMFKLLAPDIVFMDINMPVIDGLEASESIMRNNPGAKIIILSSVGDDEIVKKVKELGVSVFIKKPVSIHKIISALAQV